MKVFLKKKKKFKHKDSVTPSSISLEAKVGKFYTPSKSERSDQTQNNLAYFLNL